MNKSENKVRKELEADGYSVLHTGWPDFIAFKPGEAKWIEVKTKGTYLATNQRRMAKALFMATKLPYEVRYVYKDTPTEVFPRPDKADLKIFEKRDTFDIKKTLAAFEKRYYPLK